MRRTFQRSLEKQGMKFKMSTKVTKAVVSGETVTLTVEPSKGGAAETLEVDACLVSIGKRGGADGAGCVCGAGGGVEGVGRGGGGEQGAGGGGDELRPGSHHPPITARH